MAGWVRFVWWPSMVLFTCGAVAWVASGLWTAIADGEAAGLLVAGVGAAFLVGLVREWPRWREVTFPERRGRGLRPDRDG